MGSKITEEGPVTIPYKDRVIKVLMSAAYMGGTKFVQGRMFIGWDRYAHDWIVGFQPRKPGGAWQESWLNGRYFSHDFTAALRHYNERIRNL